MDMIVLRTLLVRRFSLNQIPLTEKGSIVR
jgi:hypothetical protein